MVNYFAGSWAYENYYRVYNGASGGGTQIYSSTIGSNPPSSQSITNSCSSGGGGGGGGGCTYSICLSDTYGDGWNGGYVNVVVNGSTVLSGTTLGSGLGPACYNFTVSSGQTIVVNYFAGSWAYENYYRVYNGASGGGTQIYGSTIGSNPPSSQSITNSCSSGGGGGGGGGVCRSSLLRSGSTRSGILS
ncbi:MAG: hypothetical protein IPM47_21250 [Sphingobacteriales bacterium]|nr:MAG: hypothetical protein IPM47_21250 [Sphingobacteriales bacterium]